MPEITQETSMTSQSAAQAPQAADATTKSTATSATKKSTKSTRKATSTRTAATKASKSDKAAKETKATAKRATRSTRSTRSAASSAAQPAFAPGSAAVAIDASEPQQFGRIVIEHVMPHADERGFAARVELGEQFTVSAQVANEDLGSIGVAAVVRTARGREVMRMPMHLTDAEYDRWSTPMRVGEPSAAKPWTTEYADIKRQLGAHTLTIEAWEDSFANWLQHARIAIEHAEHVEDVLARGAELVNRWAVTKDAGLVAAQKKTLKEAAARLTDHALDAHTRLSAVDNDEIAMLHTAHPLRDGLSTSLATPLNIERPGASFNSFYEFFVRSEGAYVTDDGKRVTGNLRSAVSGLDRANEQGFDTVVLPPIFPVGTTHRRGRNNSQFVGAADPGSPFAVGNELGGHDTIDPQLGTLDDFRAFCDYAHNLGIEVALDFTLACSPDHPWVKSHPTWFSKRSDGEIVFSIFPATGDDASQLNYDVDMPAIEAATVKLLKAWIDAGVTMFAIHEAEAAPVRFWQDVIATVTKKNPEVLFVLDSFVRPATRHALSVAGFTQTQTMFPWRNSKQDLETLLTQVNSDEAFFEHGTLWPSTPDVLSEYLRDNGIAGHAVRAVLAATGSPSWGVYNGYELIENNRHDATGEHVDNEKYEIKTRDWSRAAQFGITDLIRTLNRIRSEHAALKSFHNLTMLPTSNPAIVAFARVTPAELTGTGHSDIMIVVVNIDGYNEQHATVHVDLPQLGLNPDERFIVRDELTGEQYSWTWDNFVGLRPWGDVAHVLSVQVQH